MRPLSFLACLALCAALPAVQQADLLVHRQGDDPLWHLQLDLDADLAPPGIDPVQDVGDERWRLRLQFEGIAAADGSRRNRPPLYPVTVRTVDADGRPVLRLLARWPGRAELPDPVDATLLVDRPGERWNQRQMQLRLRQVAAGGELRTAWRGHYRDELQRRCRRMQDRELELLLHRRFFGRFPDERAEGWRDDDLIEFLQSVAGIDDLYDAVPAGEDGALVDEPRTKAPPEPILLPQVPVPEDAPETAEDDTTWYVPRSCAALSFDSIARMEVNLGWLANRIDHWSHGTWPRSAEAILEEQLTALGLDPATRRALEADGSVRITIAVWDPFFASGTNVLVVLRADRMLAVPGGAPYHHSAEEGRVVVLATGERLLDMAVAARDQGKSLAQDPHYAAARDRLVARDDATEEAFLFLSDHWLTNFISPRWRILDARRRRVDARIRLVELLRLARAAETNREDPVPLTELGVDPYLPPEDVAWLLEGLEQTPEGRIVHAELGGIGDHPPIDELPFDRVTPTEHRDYEAFRTSYQRRWRQMDPIALQIERADDAEVRARLYVSPIGRRSDWRMLRDFVAPTKLKQQILTGPAVAAGISVTVNTTKVAPMLGGVQLPVTTTIQFLSLDFAPTSFRPGTWLQDERPQDLISHLRMPAAAVAPRVLFDRLAPMVLRGESVPSDEDGIVELGADLGTDGFPLLAWMPAERNEVALAMQPAMLRALRDAEISYREDPIPSDVHVFLDLRAGYLLRRKLWQLAVKNRSLADWRRHSRLHRIAADLGLGAGDAVLQRWDGRFVFPSAEIPGSVGTNALPADLQPGDDGHWYGGSASRSFDELPASLLRLERLDGYISVEPNALLFETRLAFEPAPDRDGEPAGAEADPAAEGEATTELDFDAAE